MILHLIRHGQSTWNAEGRLQGQTMDVPLTGLGRRQAADAAGHLGPHRLAAVWSSDQLRARRTAEIIAKPHGLGVTLTPLLREQALGELEGTLIRDLREEPVPEDVHISEVCWGGGESVQQVHSRMLRLCDALDQQFDETDEVALVSHGDALRILMAVLEGRGHRDVDWVPVENCQALTRCRPGLKRRKIGC